jgi:hypothetical protein
MRGSLTALSCAALLSLCASSVAAQSKLDFSTVRYRPAIGPGSYLAVEGVAVAAHRKPTFGVHFDYADQPLRIDDPCDGIRRVHANCRNEETAFVAATGLVHLMASMSLFNRAQVSLDVPLGFSDAQPFFTRRRSVSGGQSPSISIQAREGFALADAWIAGKVRVLGEAKDRLKLAVSAHSSLPTANLTNEADCKGRKACSYLGETGVDVGAAVLGELALEDVRVAVNVGGAYRPARKFLTVETGPELRFGVASEYRFTPLFAGVIEVEGAATFAAANDLPTEARGAVRFGQDFVVTAGAGGGFGGVVGNPVFRIFAGAQWTPTRHDADGDGIEDGDDACPGAPEDRDGFMDTDGCPENDNDGDRIVDASDGCPDQAEDFDGFQDEDGCPEEDNDGDGVPDGYDSCEGQKEDLDGDRDDDGCPDYDTDRDGIQDNVDGCPEQAEDTDGLADDDGCPEDDADGDGLSDVQDACPEMSEWWNGILDDDGCPEDDEDQDHVPDQTDRCPDHAETLNGKTDDDGCPDGALLFVVKEQRLMFVTEPETVSGKPEYRRTGAVLDAVASFVRLHHQRGSLRVVMIAPVEDSQAAGKAEALATQLRARLPDVTVTSGTYPGAPARFEVELVPPAWKELPRPKPPAPPPVAPVPTTDASPALSSPNGAPAAAGVAAPAAATPPSPAPTVTSPASPAATQPK